MAERVVVEIEVSIPLSYLASAWTADEIADLRKGKREAADAAYEELMDALRVGDADIEENWQPEVRA